MRRSERMAALTKLLVDSPHRVITLSEVGRRFGAAKSTVSEDVTLLRETFSTLGLGLVETLPGAAGGVRYIPVVPAADIFLVAQQLCEILADPGRILPGGFLYMSDVVAAPELLGRLGNVFASHFRDVRPDAVVTVETQGIPIALMTARSFNIPLAIVRRVTRPAEGTVVTMNYLSGSARRVETMSLSRRALAPGARVLVVDDFMKAGGTARGLVDLAGEFGADVVGTGVLVATAEPSQKRVEEYFSLAVLERVDEERREVHVRPGPLVQPSP